MDACLGNRVSKYCIICFLHIYFCLFLKKKKKSFVSFSLSLFKSSFFFFFWGEKRKKESHTSVKILVDYLLVKFSKLFSLFWDQVFKLKDWDRLLTFIKWKTEIRIRKSFFFFFFAWKTKLTQIFWRCWKALCTKDACGQEYQ